MQENNLSGFLLINKPIGISSNQCLNKIKKIFKLKKIGHAGTLDPFAEGLLVVAVGKATKVLEYLLLEDKQYIALLKLGEQTNTADNTGEIISKKPITKFDKKTIKSVFQSLTGNQLQAIPKFSATKYQGKPLYHYARKKQKVPNKIKQITIYNLNLLNFTDNKINFQVTCSKGTYIRSLGEEIAEKLQNIGHLTYLQRTKSGLFSLVNSYKLENLANYKLTDLLLTIEHSLTNMTKIYLNQQQEVIFSYGNQFEINVEIKEINKLLLILNYQGNALGIAKIYYNQKNKKILQPKKVF